jgi:hypothetical protein
MMTTLGTAARRTAFTLAIEGPNTLHPWPGRCSEPIGARSLMLGATFLALCDPQWRGIVERLGRGPATLSQLAGRRA